MQPSRPKSGPLSGAAVRDRLATLECAMSAGHPGVDTMRLIVGLAYTRGDDALHASLIAVAAECAQDWLDATSERDWLDACDARRVA